MSVPLSKTSLRKLHLSTLSGNITVPHIEFAIFLGNFSDHQARLGVTVDARRWRERIARSRDLSPSAAWKEFRDVVRDLPYHDSDPDREDSVQLREVVDSANRTWLLLTGTFGVFAAKNHVSARMRLVSANSGSEMVR